MSQFTWLPFFEEMLSVICEKYNKISLIGIFYSIFSDAGGIEDLYSDGTKGPLKEIDPFTFIAYFNRNNTDDNRIAYCEKAKELFRLNSDVPQDFSGIPFINPQNTWFFVWEKNRDPKSINMLWELSKQLNTNSIESKLFAEVLHFKQIGVSKITQLLFICKPTLYLSLDNRNRAYLKQTNIDAKNICKQLDKADGFLHYQEFLSKIKKEINKPFYVISHEAYLHRDAKYWMMAAGEGARFWGIFMNNNIVAMAPDGTGDLNQYDSKESIGKRLDEIHNNESKPIMDRLALWEFSHEMKKGDIVIVKKGTKELLGYGTIDSDYIFDNSRQEYKHVRKVKWIKTGNWIYPFTDNEIKQFVLKTLTDITKYKGYPAQLIAFMESGGSPGNPDGVSYWWLNANPNIWDINSAKIGEKQTYTTHNEKGNKRRIYKHFEAVQPGDYVLGYVSSPDKEITTVCRITKGKHTNEEKESIEFEIVEKLSNPVTYEEIKAIPDLSNCEPLINNQGSLFRLTQGEYEVIRDLIDEKNVFAAKSEVKPYSIEKALESLFFSYGEFEDIMEVLKFKKNIILQGAPGVGKTFIAKRLAYALMQQESPQRVQMIQFHQSYSYEDFIQGYRPNDKEKFTLKNGVFYEFCKKAQRDPDNQYVFIIDEINRGNLSKIFGELMMLIEPDKRGKDYAVPLTYALAAEEKFYIPDNLYLIGTMNTADRSLALVDYALRRRFSFISLTPKYNSIEFKTFMKSKNIDGDLIEKIITKMNALNEKISKDEKNLGIGYQIGHSFFCPTDSRTKYDNEWYQRVVKHEIRPLLEEYWFDDIEGVNQCIRDLLS